MFDVVGDAAGQLADGAQPFVLHDGVLRLAKFVVGSLQLSVQARLMRGQSDVRAECPQKLALADAESIGPGPGRDENAKQIPLDNHRHNGGGAHLDFGQLFEQRRLGFRHVRFVQQFTFRARFQTRFRERQRHFFNGDLVSRGRLALQPGGGLAEGGRLGVEEIDRAIINREMDFQPAEYDGENAFQIDPFGNGMGDLGEQADARELLVQVALGPLAQDRVANRALQQRGVELAFHQIIGRPGFHGFAVHVVVAQGGQQDDRRLAAAADDGAQQLEAAVFAEPVIDEIDIVLVLLNRFQAGVVIAYPVELEIRASDFSEKFPREDVIIFIVLDEQYLEAAVIHAGGPVGGRAAPQFQTSTCRWPA